MTDEDDPIEMAKRALFGDKAELVRVSEIGSGISKTTRLSIDFQDGLDRFGSMPLPWTQIRDMIERLFSPILERSRQCPGTDYRQCCHARNGERCFPNWREREDPEWYAQEIDKTLSQVNSRIRPDGPLVPAIAAAEAFELGCLFTEALAKFRWDKHAKRGKATADSSKRGGDEKRYANPKRLSIAETVASVDALLARGKSKKSAYCQVAVEQDISEQTVRKEYRAATKER